MLANLLEGYSALSASGNRFEIWLEGWSCYTEVMPFAASMKNPHTFGQTAEDKLYIMRFQ